MTCHTHMLFVCCLFACQSLWSTLASKYLICGHSADDHPDSAHFRQPGVQREAYSRLESKLHTAWLLISPSEERCELKLTSPVARAFQSNFTVTFYKHSGLDTHAVYIFHEPSKVTLPPSHTNTASRWLSHAAHRLCGMLLHKRHLSTQTASLGKSRAGPFLSRLSTDDRRLPGSATHSSMIS
jgi:hypothetical protein